MSIEKYTTECLVIESFPSGEHDRVYKLFTREFGMLTAHGKSIRKLGSRLRAHIQPRTRSLVTLVKGRDIWRLVGAQEQKKIPKFIHEITQLINRFIRGEGEHRVLYDRLIQFFEDSSLYEDQKSRLLFYYMILVDLGYSDAKVIGAKDMKEYVSWSVDDLYNHLLLSYKDVRTHVGEVMKEIQL